ncbi:MAG: hypothetical protein ABW007_28340 [Chitinophagaceae bacterium]
MDRDKIAIVTENNIFLKTPDGRDIIIAGLGIIDFRELSEEDLNEMIQQVLDPKNIVDPDMN